MSFISINDVPRVASYNYFVTFNAQSGVIRISTAMMEIGRIWDIQFNVETRQLRCRPSDDGFKFRGNCIGCHKAFVASLGFDPMTTNNRFDMVLNSDGWYCS